MQAGLGKAKSMLTGFASKAITVGLGAAGAGSVAGGLLLAAKKAADLGESVSKVKVVFGGASKGMIDQADELARKFGVVKQSVLDAGAGFGLMGRAAGLSAESSAKLGQEMVQLGLDMASFHNISNEEAFEKLRSGLAGEAEPLRPLGILLSEDAVKAEALATGLIKVKRELTDQEKVLARLSLIRKQAGPAIGDLERTADSAANQMRKLEGELQNAAVEFGSSLQDALKDGISLARELGGVLKEAGAKEFGDGLGEAIRTGINTARVLMNTPAVAQAQTVIDPSTGKPARRTQENGFADAWGLRMRPAAAPNGQTLQDVAGKIVGGQAAAGNGLGDVAAQRQKMLAAEAAWRQQKEDERIDLQDRNDEAKERKAREERQAAGRGIGAHLLGQLGNLAGGLGAGPGGQGAINKFGANLIAGIGLGKAGGGLVQAGMQLAHGAADAARRHIDKPAFQSQSFASGGDFAQFAIQKALSDDPDKKEKELQALEQARDKLGDLNEIASQCLQMVLTAPPLRAILRGAS